MRQPPSNVRFGLLESGRNPRIGFSFVAKCGRNPKAAETTRAFCRKMRAHFRLSRNVVNLEGKYVFGAQKREISVVPKSQDSVREESTSDADLDVMIVKDKSRNRNLKRERPPKKRGGGSTLLKPSLKVVKVTNDHE